MIQLSHREDHTEEQSPQFFHTCQFFSYLENASIATGVFITISIFSIDSTFTGKIPTTRRQVVFWNFGLSHLHPRRSIREKMRGEKATQLEEEEEVSDSIFPSH